MNNLGEIAGLITAVTLALTAVCTATYKMWKAIRDRIRSDVRREILQEQSLATVTAKNEEIEDLRKRNAKLWALVESQTE